MRNVLVVLVFSYIGLSCGLIVPSGMREIIADLAKSANSIENSGSKPRNIIKRNKLNISSVNITETSELLTNEIRHNSSNNSLDNDLYENNNEKNSIIEERSFIYLKQRAKKPYLKNIFEIIPETNMEKKPLKSLVLSHSILNNVSSHVLTGNRENKFFDKIVGPSNYDLYHSKINNIVNYYFDRESKQQIKAISNQQLIKGPIVRPFVKTNKKDFISMENSLFNFTIGRKLLENFANPDGDNLDRIVDKVLQKPISEKPKHVDHDGVQCCRNCFKKGKIQTFNSRPRIDSICKCGRKSQIKIKEDQINN